MDASTALGINNARAQTRLVRELRQIRMDSGLSIDFVAGAMKVDPEFVIEFERGGMNFSAATLRNYAKAVNAELSHSAVSTRNTAIVSSVTGRRAEPQAGWGRRDTDKDAWRSVSKTVRQRQSLGG